MYKAISKLWANRIKAGERTIDDVPLKLKKEVEAILEEGYKFKG